MKGRSNRVADPAPDEWVNGSWTVDCMCGVTFDDGEEMVNCDECGVWVHTRCSRFAKGDKSFACDKCKASRARARARTRTTTTTSTDSEETEVAQLLVDLPTKTLTMNHHHHPFPPPRPRPLHNVNNRHPYCLWTQRPLEERVHVQGVPGGDPALFDSTVPLLFSPHLWKSTGYVPKKFNFRYPDFPCWDAADDDEAQNALDTLAPAAGAGLLYSFSKEIEGAVPVSSDKRGSKERILAAGKSLTTPRPPALHSFKRTRDDSGPSKDRTAKKKSKSAHRDHDTAMRDKVPALKTAVPHSTNTTPVQVHESKADKVESSPHPADGCNIDKPKTNAVSDEANLVPRFSQESAVGNSSEKAVKAEETALDATDQIGKSANTESVLSPSLDKDVITEGSVLPQDKIRGSTSGSPSSDLLQSKPLLEDIVIAAPDLKDNGNLGNQETIVPLASGHCNSASTKSDANHVYPTGVLGSDTADTEGRISAPNLECENSKLNEAVATGRQALEQEGRESDKALEVASDCQFDKKDEATDNQCNNKNECDGSESSTVVQKMLSDSKEVSKVVGQTPKLGAAIPPPPPIHHKTVSVGKSSSTSPAIVFSRSSLSDKSRTGSSRSSSCVGKRLMSNSTVNTKKEKAPIDSVKNEVKHEPRSTVKDNPKSSANNSISKASHPNRTVTSPYPRHYTSAGKDSARHASSKMSTAESSSLSSGVNEPAGAPSTEHAVHGHNKNIASCGQQRGEKVPQSNLQSTSKSTQSSLGHPPVSSSSPAGLSDEELALLLHQELNSSPRVPRVPRVRHAGSLPQLSSATATSMLIKRTSSSGGKDQHTFSRRKSKDVLKDRNSREQDSEARKPGRVPSSPDSVKTSDALTQAEGNNESSHSVKKNCENTSGANSGSISTDADELKSSSTRDSPVNNCEDDLGTNKGLAPTYRTLPGLIAEIMGSGRRMSYEELCNAVLPHWPNLRKHNGERYAYSSHSQAVLDCLRNRTEWARLVDRGPKTSASRKKRKSDAEPANTESEDGEGRTVKDGVGKSFETNKEEFPKGRRKARKRRRLALQGRGVRDDHKRRKVEVGSDESGSFSNSDEDSVSTEDDSQGSGMGEAKSDASTSSHEVGTVS